MSGDAFEAARVELYGLEPEQFLMRRKELAELARTAGDPLAVKRIAALRKPTRAAYVANQLTRADPDALDRIDALAAALLDAQRSLDGSRIREQSTARNALIRELCQSALQAAGIRSAPVALRDEVTNTLAAALADPDIRDELRVGALVRPARWDGFGGDAGPGLTLVPPTPITVVPSHKAQESAQPEPREPPARERPVSDRRESRRAELTERLDEAVAAMRAADKAVTEQQHELRTVEHRLADAQRRLDELMLDARMAQRRLDTAQSALDRLPPR